MSTSALSNELLQIPLDVKPATPVFLCRSTKDYHRAVKIYSIKWSQREAASGKWDEWTLKSFYNWIVALMKLRSLEEAESRCRAMLRDLQADTGVDSDAFYCLQCLLATGLFLSNQKEEAESIFRQIRQQTKMLNRQPASDFYQVLCLTRATQADCSALHHSSDGIEPDLVQIYNYSAQRDGIATEPGASLVSSAENGTPTKGSIKSPNPFKNFISFKFGSLRRSLSQSRRSSGQNTAIKTRFQFDGLTTYPVDEHLNYQRPKNEDENKSSLNHQPVVHPDQSNHWLGQRRSSKPSQVSSTNAEDEIVPLTIDKSIRQQYGEPSQSLLQTAKVETWLRGVGAEPRQQNQSDQVHGAKQGQVQAIASSSQDVMKASASTADLLRDNEFTDVMLGLTERSDRTHTSSQIADVQPKILQVTAWNPASAVRHDKKFRAFLDDGSDVDCVSEILCNYIQADIDPSRTNSLYGPNRQEMEVLGKVKIYISWDISATQSAKLHFYVIKDLWCDMLIGRRVINHLKLSECSAPSASFVNSILKEQPPHIRQLCTPNAPAINSALALDHKISSGDGNDSLIGGSETTAPSRTTSLTGTIHSKSTTRSNTPHSMAPSVFSRLGN